MKILQTLHVLNATETHSTLSISYFISFFGAIVATLKQNRCLQAHFRYTLDLLPHLSLVRSEFGRFFDDSSLAALGDGRGVLWINFHLFIITTRVAF